MGRWIALIALLAVGLAASCFVAGKRAFVESGNRAVEIVVDYDEVAQVAAASGVETVEVLRRFRSAGATSVAVTEQTFGDAVDARVIFPYGPQSFRVQGDGERIASRLQAALPNLDKHILSTDVTPSDSLGLSSLWLLSIGAPIPMSYLEQIPVGLPSAAVEDVRDAGMEMVARLMNYPGVTPESAAMLLQDTKAKGARTVVFSGDQVLGFQGAVPDTAKALAANKLYFGQVEFARQKGERTLAAKAPANVIVVHSITQSEMPTLSVSTIAERYERAVRERGVRMCYVRLYHTAGDDLVGDNARYIHAIANGIERAGYEPKPARPLNEIAVPGYARIAAGVGVGAGVALLLLCVFDLSMIATVLWCVPIIAVCAGLSAFGEVGRKAVALLAAVSFPILAATCAVVGSPDSPRLTREPVLRAAGRTIGAFLIAVAGGVLIVGLLSERAFVLRLDQFAGVKLAHILPLVILAALFAGGIAWSRDSWGLQMRRMARHLRDLASSPVLMWQAVGALAVLVFVGLMLARSGNEAGVGVSGVELKLRAVLDKLLYVRPRTKEFLIGYPALFLGIAFALRGYRRWAAPLVVVGAIGLISTVNTFCHIHTPLLISAVRVVNGLIAGIVVGLIAYLIFRHSPGRETK